VHFKVPPLPKTVEFIEGAPVEKVETGLRAVVEIVAYQGGHFRLSSGRIEGSARSRVISQAGTLMFRDADETKDALDAIVDRLGAAAGAG
jgi:hypothetical protein